MARSITFLHFGYVVDLNESFILKIL
jgi:hypothetical protein